MTTLEKKCSSPILLLIFNRPETTKQVFDQIRKARPSKLFIAADGPRENNPEDFSLCSSVRRITENIDWECEVKTLFRDKNLGCRTAVSQAISWFFSFVDKGIILEDDCLPDFSFFNYCEELLNFYEFDERIGIISGNNFINSSNLDFSYYFTNFPHIWGWATWKRTWARYDLEMEDWLYMRKTKFLQTTLGNKSYVKIWREIFDQMYENKIDTWDYQLVYNLWKHNQLCIAPKYNLVSNIGFGHSAIHTSDSESKFANLPVKNIELPLNHPIRVERNMKFDNSELKILFGSQSIIDSLLKKIIIRFLPNKISL